MFFFTLLVGASVAIRNVVFTVATGYRADTIEPFLASLRVNGFSGDIFVGVKSNQLVHLAPLARLYEVNLINVDLNRHWSENRAGYPVPLLRYSLYIDWCKRLSDHDRILTADIRDTYAQRNPFAAEFTQNFAAVNLFAEDDSETIVSERVNADWVSKCFGRSALQKYGHNPIICGGNMLGTATNICWVFAELFREATRKLLCAPTDITDQATLGYLFYSRWSKNETFRVWPRGVGPVNTLAIVPPDRLLVDETGRALNDDHKVSALVHQYDRHPRLMQTYKKMALAAKRHWQRQHKQ